MNSSHFRAAVLIGAAFHLACKSDPTAASAPTPAGQTAPPGAAAAPPTTPPNPAPHAGPVSTTPVDHGTPPAMVAPHTLDKLPDGRLSLGPFSLQVPSGWIEKPSNSNMRAAQFQLPAPEGTEAEVIVYHFGETGAGSVDANIDRWLSQFKQPDGKTSREVAKIDKAQFAGQDSTLVSVSGRYVATPPGGGDPVDKPDQTLMAVIVPSPRGPYYFRMIGSTSAVEAQAPRFREALASLKLM